MGLFDNDFDWNGDGKIDNYDRIEEDLYHDSIYRENAARRSQEEKGSGYGGGYQSGSGLSGIGFLIVVLIIIFLIHPAAGIAIVIVFGGLIGITKLVEKISARIRRKRYLESQKKTEEKEL